MIVKLKKMLSNIMAQKPIEDIKDALEFTYEDLLNLEYKLIDATDTYRYNAEYNIYEDMSKDESFMKQVYDNSEDFDKTRENISHGKIGFEMFRLVTDVKDFNGAIFISRNDDHRMSIRKGETHCFHPSTVEALLDWRG